MDIGKILLRKPLALFSLLIAALAGCAVNTPFQWPGLERSRQGRELNPKQTVLVVITHATVKRAKRGPFDDNTQYVYATLGTQRGLLGYSIRRELLGDGVWTVTAWLDETSMQDFVRSSAHQQAIVAGSPALKTLRFKRIEMSAGDLPLSWAKALTILGDEVVASHARFTH